MFLVNLVPLLLVVGVLTQSGVDATEHLEEDQSDLREAVESLFDEFISASLSGNTDAVVSLHDKDAKILVDGFPPATGLDEIRTLVELLPERAAKKKWTVKEVWPMDKDENYVYTMFYFENFNKSGEKYLDGTSLTVLKKDEDQYKFYLVMFNTHNQAT
ncbi:uncharacterized protein [Asterias amurensis]|uniref:uncharacterized protein n=1 Tax=Asterias amurensis TaxID=7602 RepID=UPI003AB44D37